MNKLLPSYNITEYVSEDPKEIETFSQSLYAVIKETIANNAVQTLLEGLTSIADRYERVSNILNIQDVNNSKCFHFGYITALSSLGIDCDISTWFGLMAPKGTPTEIRENLFKEICLTLESNETMHTFERLSGGAKLLGPQEFNEWIQNEQVKYRSFLSALKI